MPSPLPQCSRRLLLLAISFCVVFLGHPFAGGIGGSASADEAFCKAYADEAVATVANQKRLGCNFEGRRWSSDWNTHFSVCMEASQDTVNGGLHFMNEYATRSSDLAKCAADKSGVPTPFDTSSPFKGDDPPTLESFCRAYAYVGNHQTAGAVRDCGYTGRRWEATFDVHLQVCMNDWGADAGGFMAAETYQRTIDRVACAVRRAAATSAPQETTGGTKPGGDGEIATVVNATTVYNEPGGNDVCYPQAGDTGKVLQKQDGEPRWLLLSGISGDCGGKNGWVWRGDNNEDVSLN